MFCDTAPAAIQTVLGTSVAVSLWDAKRNFGGMNHFLFPRPETAEGATPRYGVAATLGLIQMMVTAGAECEHMVAQIFGGARRASATAAQPSLGRLNVEAARDVLTQRGISIISEDVGGEMGRKVVFDTLTGHVMVIKVHQLRDSDWLDDTAWHNTGTAR